jgi:hypothetical protein
MIKGDALLLCAEASVEKGKDDAGYYKNTVPAYLKIVADAYRNGIDLKFSNIKTGEG